MFSLCDEKNQSYILWNLIKFSQIIPKVYLLDCEVWGNKWQPVIVITYDEYRFSSNNGGTGNNKGLINVMCTGIVRCEVNRTGISGQAQEFLGWCINKIR